MRWPREPLSRKGLSGSNPDPGATATVEAAFRGVPEWHGRRAVFKQGSEYGGIVDAAEECCEITAALANDRMLHDVEA